jgi:peptidoglycan/LPS O-acetylase OafA/YrhL
LKTQMLPHSSASRIAALDSLRGIAALSVVFHHCLVVYPGLWAVYRGPAVIESESVQFLAYTPLHMFWGGLEAVIVFYVLSGFVLSIPFLGLNSPTYFAFAAKRFCRIYFPYITSVFLAALLLNKSSTSRIAGQSEWFNQYWNLPARWPAILDHILMLGTAKWDYINPVVWSLVHEMRISLIFPVLIWLALRVRWQILVPISLAVSLAAKVVIRFVAQGVAAASLLETISYLFLFIAGAELCIHRVWLKRGWERLNGRAKWVLFVSILASLNARWEPLVRLPVLSTLMVWTGAIGLIAATSSASRLTALLDQRPLRWLGRVSYSLYLIHVPILFFMMYALHHQLRMLVIVASVPPLSLIAAGIFYRFVELPSIRLSRKLESELQRRRHDRKHSRAIGTLNPLTFAK